MYHPQGHQAVFDVSEGQLDALAGSDTLRAEVITQVGCRGGSCVEAWDLYSLRVGLLIISGGGRPRLSSRASSTAT